MGSLKEIRNRITSVKSTQQITRAMKMVSAAKLKKAQDAIIKIRPYTFKLNEVISTLIDGIDNLSLNPYFKQREVEKILLVPIAGDKGLCGSFNSAVIRETNKIINTYNTKKAHHYQIDVLTIGKKSYDYFRKTKINITESHSDLSKKVSFRDVDSIASKILNQFEAKKYDLVFLIYNSFKNPAVYQTTVHQFLPIVSLDENEVESSINTNNFIFEPNEEEIVNGLIPKSLKINFYRAILESNAAEHGSRMTAMDKATENAEELIGELKLFYNKARQAAITTEILEIVGGSTGL